MRRLAYALLGVLVLAAALVATLPAGHAYRWIEAPSQPLRLYEIRGRAWDGRAVADLGGQRIDQLDWRWHPLALLSGRLGLTIAWAHAGERGEARVALGSASRLRVESLDGRLRAQRFGLIPAAALLRPEGELDLDLRDVEVVAGRIASGRGRIVWSGARIALGGAEVPLGTLAADVAPAPDGVRVVLRDLGGPLEAGGSVTLLPDGQYDVQLQLAPRADAPAELVRALTWLGAPDAAGRHQIRQRGRY